MTTLTLVSRTYCHLCHEMESDLRRMGSEVEFDLVVVDVDEHPELLALYDELVPVLLHDGSELCHYFLDRTKVRDCLSQIDE